jgi:hypothetical protein
MSKAADTLKKRWTHWQPGVHDFIDEMMAISIIIKVNQMSKAATDALWAAGPGKPCRHMQEREQAR